MAKFGKKLVEIVYVNRRRSATTDKDCGDGFLCDLGGFDLLAKFVEILLAKLEICARRKSTVSTPCFAKWNMNVDLIWLICHSSVDFFFGVFAQVIARKK